MTSFIEKEKASSFDNLINHQFFQKVSVALRNSNIIFNIYLHIFAPL